MKQKILLLTLGIVVCTCSSLSAQNQTVTLDLSKPVNPAELTLDPEKGYWTESFSNAPLEFEHFTCTHDGGMFDTSGYWSGFVVGSNGDTADYGSPDTEGWLTNQWGNMAGGGIKTDADGNILKDEDGHVLVEKGIPYLIANRYMDMDIVLDTIYEAAGVYLNNHPWPYYGNLNGDNFARALDREGDFYKVIITGLNPDKQETGSVEYLFAEYKDGELKQGTAWEWVDLSPLGKISSLSFTLESSDVGEWGMNTSGYFCLDKLQVRKTSSDSGIILPVKATTGVYPNPVADQLVVTGSSIRRVQVTDLSGRLVYQLSADGQSRLAIPVSSWAGGVYIVRITDAAGASSHKVIKK